MITFTRNVLKDYKIGDYTYGNPKVYGKEFLKSVISVLSAEMLSLSSAANTILTGYQPILFQPSSAKPDTSKDIPFLKVLSLLETTYGSAKRVPYYLELQSVMAQLLAREVLSPKTSRLTRLSPEIPRLTKNSDFLKNGASILTGNSNGGNGR